MTRDGEAGFTLIETLIALAVLATASVAMMGATQAQLRQVADLEKRTAALWLAETASVERGLGLAQANPTEAAIYGYDFRIDIQESETSDSNLQKLVIEVTDPRNEADGQVWARLEDFMLKRPRLSGAR